MRISDWSSDVCSSDLLLQLGLDVLGHRHHLFDALHHASLRLLVSHAVTSASGKASSAAFTTGVDLTQSSVSARSFASASRTDGAPAASSVVTFQRCPVARWSPAARSATRSAGGGLPALSTISGERKSTRLNHRH